MRIAIDAMGGDHAPGSIIAGAIVAARHLQCGLLLAGPRPEIERELARHPGAGALDIAVVQAPDRIDMDEPAAAALRRKPGASIRVAADAVRAGEADAVIMCAAVADYTPAGGATTTKIEKSGDLRIDLVRTADILADLGRWRGERERPVLVGFAAQTGKVEAAARRKLLAKRVDLIVANDVLAPDAGFEVDTNQVTLVSHEGSDALPLMSKDEVAGIVLDRVEQALAREPVARSRA